MQAPVGKDLIQDWGNLSDLNFKLNALLAGGIITMIVGIWRFTFSSGQNNSKDIKEIKEMLASIQTELRFRPTHDEVNEKIMKYGRIKDN